MRSLIFPIDRHLKHRKFHSSTTKPPFDDSSIKLDLILNENHVPDS